jgi:hypothetical protein
VKSKIVNSLHLAAVNFDESFQRAVKGALNIIREKACREFLHAPMIFDAFTAFALV